MHCGKEVAGFITLKHVYEIANHKLDDINCAGYTLQQMCINVINVARMAGIKVLKHDIDPAELDEFLKRRDEINKQQRTELAEKRAAKLMRAANAAAAAAAAASATTSKK